MMMKIISILCFSILIVFTTTGTVMAGGDITTRPSTPHVETPKSKPVNKCKAPCLCSCKGKIQQNHVEIRDHKSEEFRKHRKWMVDVLLETTCSTRHDANGFSIYCRCHAASSYDWTIF